MTPTDVAGRNADGVEYCSSEPQLLLTEVTVHRVHFDSGISKHRLCRTTDFMDRFTGVEWPRFDPVSARTPNLSPSLCEAPRVAQPLGDANGAPDTCERTRVLNNPSQPLNTSVSVMIVRRYHFFFEFFLKLGNLLFTAVFTFFCSAGVPY